jgi:hypothetical protein
MNIREAINLLENENETTKEIEESAWWLTRWVSGSMNDPDWDDSWTTFGLEKAFDILHKVVGNRFSLQKPLWRYLAVKKQLAKQIIQSKILPKSPKGIFQSFTIDRNIAAVDGPEILGYIPKGHIELLVSISPSPTYVMFGMNDLKKSKLPEIKDALLQLSDWIYQKEVIVKIENHIPLESVEILEDN